MLRRRALWVLRRLGESEPGKALPATRVAAYRELDPVSRPIVRSRVVQAVAEARLSTAEGDDDGHVHRLAFLDLAGSPSSTPDDVDQTRARFNALAGEVARPAPRAVLWLTLASGAAVLLLLGGGAWWAFRPPAPLRELDPAARDAWVVGGRPDPGDEATRHLFAETLPAYVVGLDRLRATLAEHAGAEAAPDAETVEARAALEGVRRRLVDEAARALGRDALSYLRAVIAQAESLVAEPGTPASDSHLRSVDALNAAIARLGLGYYVDAEVLTDLRTGRTRVYLASFGVEGVRLYESESSTERALRLRRLDELSFTRSVLGFTRAHIRDGLVLVDKVEGFLTQHVLPALVPDGAMPLVRGDVDRDGRSWLVEAEAAAGTDARAEATALVGESERTTRLGAAFATRRDLFDRWATRLARDGVVIRVPAAFDVDLARYAWVEARVPRDEWRALAHAHDVLQEDSVRRAYGRVEEAFIASVERHEVQHRLDFRRWSSAGDPHPMDDAPSELALSPSGGPPRYIAELSAYLSELARERSIVKTNLALLMRHVFDPRGSGTAETGAAVAILRGLVDELGLASIPPGPLGPPTAATAYLAVREQSAADLTGAARRLWRRFFDRPLPELRRAVPNGR